MTKAELAQKISEKAGFGRRESLEMIETLLEIMKESLAQGEKIKISGFGNFAARPKRERVGRNPQTGAQLKITARRVLTFKASHILKQAVNRGRP